MLRGYSQITLYSRATVLLCVKEYSCFFKDMGFQSRLPKVSVVSRLLNENEGLVRDWGWGTSDVALSQQGLFLRYNAVSKSRSLWFWCLLFVMYRAVHVFCDQCYHWSNVICTSEENFYWVVIRNDYLWRINNDFNMKSGLYHYTVCLSVERIFPLCSVHCFRVVSFFFLWSTFKYSKKLCYKIKWDHILILGIGLELARNWGKCRESFQMQIAMIFHRLNLH